jgi:hypothetical protein
VLDLCLAFYHLPIYPFTGLPKALRTQQLHRWVVADDCGALQNRLRGEHAVERVAMRMGKSARLDGVLIGNGKVRKTVGFDQFAELKRRLLAI